MDIYTPRFKSKSKDCDSVLPYTYLLKFEINGAVKYYYGLRYGNISRNRSPNQDLWKKYFSSSKEVKRLIKEGNHPTEVIIHKTFETAEDAIDYEIKFLTRIGAGVNPSFLNKMSNIKCKNINKGRVCSQERRNQMSNISKATQSSQEYRDRRRQQAKERWANPEFRKKMEEKNAKWCSSRNETYWKERGANRIGETHKIPEDVREKLSILASKRMKSYDWSLIPRWNCPICSKTSMPGSPFNSHMIGSHKWSKEQCQMFKNFPRKDE